MSPTSQAVALNGSTVNIRPSVSHMDVRQFAEDVFGLVPDPNFELRELHSYDDRNFHIRGCLQPRTDHDGSHSHFNNCQNFVLKIYNSLSGDQAENLSIIDQMIQLADQYCKPVRLALLIPPLVLAEKEISTAIVTIPLNEDFIIVGDLPKHQETFKDFKHIISVNTDNNAPNQPKFVAKHFIQLFPFLEGKCPVTAEDLNRKLCEDIGQLAANMRCAFQNIDYKACMERTEYIWKLDNAKMLISLLKFVDVRYKKICVQVLQNFLDNVLHRSDIERGYTHSDLNEQNLFISPNCDLVGVIDFCDAQYARPIYDLAIAMAYIGILAPTEFTKNTTSILIGYMRGHAITDAEFDVLFDVVLLRMVQSIVMSSYTHSVLDPTNMYLLENQKTTLAFLEIVFDVSSEEGEIVCKGRDGILKSWKQAMDENK